MWENQREVSPLTDFLHSLINSWAEGHLQVSQVTFHQKLAAPFPLDTVWQALQRSAILDFLLKVELAWYDAAHPSGCGKGQTGFNGFVGILQEQMVLVWVPSWLVNLFSRQKIGKRHYFIQWTICKKNIYNSKRLIWNTYSSNRGSLVARVPLLHVISLPLTLFPTYRPSIYRICQIRLL